MSVMASYASRVFATVAGIRSRSRLVENCLASLVGGVVAFLLVLVSGSWESFGAEISPPPPATSHLEQTNSQELLQLSLQLQEQLRAAQIAIEQNRQEAKEAAAQNAEAVSEGLESIQQALSAQRARDMEAMQRSNQVMLIVVGTFAAMSFLAMLIMTYFQWRMSTGLAEISAALPAALGLGPGSTAAALAPAAHSDLRLLGRIEQPEERTREPEQHTASKGCEATSIESRLFPEPGDLVRRRQFRALRLAVIVGLICAAMLALLLYLVTCMRLRFG